MYYPLYNNPFYYPSGAYMQNICSYGNATSYIKSSQNKQASFNSTETSYTNRNSPNAINDNNTNEIFSINGDRLEVFGISINIDDLIILIILFFLFKENNVDYSIIIILALILFDQC